MQQFQIEGNYPVQTDVVRYTGQIETMGVAPCYTELTRSSIGMGREGKDPAETWVRNILISKEIISGSTIVLGACK